MRRAAKVDQSQQAIVEWLRAQACKVDIIGRPVDLLVRIGSRYVTAECKTPGPNQRRRMKAQIDHASDAASHYAPHFLLMGVNDAADMYRDVMSGQGGVAP